MRPLAVVLLCVSCLTGPAQAQWYDSRTGKPAPDTEWRKSSGKLGAALLLTADAEAFLKDWSESPELHMPIAKSIAKVKRGDIVTAFILFSGCGEGAATCNASVDFKTLKPDGTIYGNSPGNPAWAGPPPKPGLVVLSHAYLQIRIEPQDPLGMYQVLSVFKDAAATASIGLKQQFEVVK